MSRRHRPPSGRSNSYLFQPDTNVFASKKRPSTAKNSRNQQSPQLSTRNSLRPVSANSERRPSSRNPSPVCKFARPQSASARSGEDNSQLKQPSINKKGTLFKAPDETGIGISRPGVIEDAEDEDDIKQYRFLPAAEIIARMREDEDFEKKERESEATRLMPEYNAFSRPRESQEYPLRSVFLDPAANNFPPSRTRSELMKKIKLSSMPHPSYDIDGDGWVSVDDYRIAKRFDFDGNGVIDPDEKRVAKHVVSQEFFATHKDNLHVFGENIAKASMDENVSKLEHSVSFERTYSHLKRVEESLKGRSSKVMVSCMNSSNPRLTKDNYYSNQFDTTAYNTFEAIPYKRGKPTLSHSGSRRTLLLQRKEAMQRELMEKFESAAACQPKYRTTKLSLISNFSLEN